MKPYLDMFHQGKLLVPGVALDCQFHLNDSKLFFNAEKANAASKVSLNADNMKLTFCFCVVKLVVTTSGCRFVTCQSCNFPVSKRERKSLAPL